VASVAGLPGVRRQRQGGPDLEDRSGAEEPLARPVHAPELRGQGSPPDRRSPVAGRRAALYRPARRGHVLRAELSGRRAGGRRRHEGLVRRPGLGNRRRPRGDRLRAGLARHHRLPRPQPPRRPPPPARARGHGSLAAAERDRLPGGRRLRLGAGGADGRAAAGDRDREGARVHAQRHPLRLDGREHQARPRHLPAHRRQALRHQHGRERPRPGPLPPGRPPDHRLVQPGSTRAGATAHHQHLEPEGRRIPVDQPAGVRTVLPGPPDRVVSAPGPHLRTLRDELGEAAAGSALRAPGGYPLRALGIP
jgi:hypothetical protein